MIAPIEKEIIENLHVMNASQMAEVLEGVSKVLLFPGLCKKPS